VSAESAFVYLRTILAYLVAWLGSQKGIGFCLNRGPLTTGDAKSSLAKFTAIYVLPLYPAKNHVKGTEKLKEIGRLGLEVVVKTGLLILVFSWMSEDVDNYSYHIALVHAFTVYLFLAAILNVASFIGLVLFDVTSVDSFNCPFLATSFSDLWRRRWNFMTSLVFRSLSYDIVVDGSFVRADVKNEKRVPEWRRSVGVFAVFGLSGLTHAFCFWCMFGLAGVDWFVYFILQAVLLLTERQLQSWSAKILGISSVPSWISIPFVLCVNLLVGRRFFIWPLLDVGTLDASIQLRRAILGQ